MTAAYHLDLDNSHDLANRLLSSTATQGSTGSLGGTIQCNLEALTRLHSDRQELCRQSVKLECTTAAVCIATWTMLAWGSPWVDGLSSCKIRHAQFGDNDRVPALIQRECSSVCICNITPAFHELGTNTTQKLPCCQPYFEGRIFLSLAVLLSELALACPVSVVQAHRSIRFVIHTITTTSEEDLSVSASELIAMVYRATSRHYRTAVRYCLNQDDVALAAARLNAPPYQYSPSRFYMKVVLNLNRHYQPLHQHSVKHSARYDHLRSHAEIASLSYQEI